jgi:hypothetical protein
MACIRTTHMLAGIVLDYKQSPKLKFGRYGSSTAFVHAMLSYAFETQVQVHKAAHASLTGRCSRHWHRNYIVWTFCCHIEQLVDFIAST